MKHFTFVFTGEVTVSVNNEEEALQLAESCTAPSPYQYENAEDISIYDYKLTENWEDEE